MVTPEKGCRTRKPEGEERVLGSPTNTAAGQKHKEKTTLKETKRLKKNRAEN